MKKLILMILLIVTMAMSVSADAWVKKYDLDVFGDETKHEHVTKKVAIRGEFRYYSEELKSPYLDLYIYNPEKVTIDISEDKWYSIAKSHLYESVTIHIKDYTGKIRTFVSKQITDNVIPLTKECSLELTRALNEGDVKILVITQKPKPVSYLFKIRFVDGLDNMLSELDTRR